VDVSTDAGTTWAAARVKHTGPGTASVRLPHLPTGTLTVKVAAVDTGGQSVMQVLVAAAAIQPRRAAD
jgi:hypothetical protein